MLIFGRKVSGILLHMILFHLLTSKSGLRRAKHLAPGHTAEGREAGFQTCSSNSRGVVPSTPLRPAPSTPPGTLLKWGLHRDQARL